MRLVKGMKGDGAGQDWGFWEKISEGEEEGLKGSRELWEGSGEEEGVGREGGAGW